MQAGGLACPIIFIRHLIRYARDSGQPVESNNGAYIPIFAAELVNFRNNFRTSFGWSPRVGHTRKET